jgi:hypothetical protein
MAFQAFHSYPKRLGDSTIDTVSGRNLKRRFVEIFEEFWLSHPQHYFLEYFPLHFIRKKRFQSNDSIVRNLLTRTFPWDPLAQTQGPMVDIYCLVAEKDLELLKFTLPSLQNLSSNPIRNYYIVAPESLGPRIVDICKELQLTYFVISDEYLLEKFNIRAEIFIYGHPKMLILKYLCALISDLDNVLVVDGDTVFLKQRQWLTPDKKLIVVSQELHAFHVDYCQSYFAINSSHKLGFTTQSQILSKKDIEGIVFHIGGLNELVKNFSDVYRDFHTGINMQYFPAEWQLACEWSCLFNSRKSTFGNYSNLSFNRNHFFDFMDRNGFISFDQNCHAFLKKTVPFLGSISLHDYK